MAMDAGKLKAYMESKDEGIKLDDESLEGDELELDEDDSEDEIEVVDEEGFAEFLSELFDVRDALNVAAGEIAAELVHEEQPDADTVEQMKEQLGEMPAPIQEGIADFIKGMEYEHVVELAEKLDGDEGLIDDPKQVAGWLYWIAKNV